MLSVISRRPVRLRFPFFVVLCLFGILSVPSAVRANPICTEGPRITCELWLNSTQRVTRLSLNAGKVSLPGQFQSYAESASPSANAVFLNLQGLDEKATRMVARALHVFGGSLPTNQSVGLFVSGESLDILAPISSNLNHFSWKARSLTPAKAAGDQIRQLKEIAHLLGKTGEPRKVLFWVTTHTQRDEASEVDLLSTLQQEHVRLALVKLHLPGFTDHADSQPPGKQQNWLEKNVEVNSKSLIDAFIELAVLPHNGGILTLGEDAIAKAGLCGQPDWTLLTPPVSAGYAVSIANHLPACKSLPAAKTAKSQPVVKAPELPKRRSEPSTQQPSLPSPSETTSPESTAADTVLKAQSDGGATVSQIAPTMQQLEPELQPLTEKGDIHFSEEDNATRNDREENPLLSSPTDMADVPPVITGALLQAASPGIPAGMTKRSIFQFMLFTLIGLISVMIFFGVRRLKPIPFTPQQWTDQTVLMQKVTVPDGEMVTRISYGYLIYNNSGSPQPFVLNKPTVSVGRSADNDIVIRQNTVSSHHLLIRCDRNTGVSFTDLKSTNGTLINGEAVPQATLRAGDLLSLGDIELIFERNLSNLNFFGNKVGLTA